MTDIAEAGTKAVDVPPTAKMKKKPAGKPVQPKVHGKAKAAGQESKRTDPARQPDKPAKGPTKQQQLVNMLKQPEGASIAQLSERFGWLPHSTRAALTGLRKAGHAIGRSTSIEGATIYRIG